MKRSFRWTRFQLLNLSIIFRRRQKLLCRYATKVARLIAAVLSSAAKDYEKSLRRPKYIPWNNVPAVAGNRPDGKITRLQLEMYFLNCSPAQVNFAEDAAEFSLRWTGTLKVPATGNYTLGIELHYIDKGSLNRQAHSAE
jgi:hypothetical protein